MAHFGSPNVGRGNLLEWPEKKTDLGAIMMMTVPTDVKVGIHSESTLLVFFLFFFSLVFFCGMCCSINPA